MAELDDIREELALAREEIATLRIKATTTLSGTEFLTLLMVGPVIAAFVILGIIIVWKTTSNPEQVAPHLDIILVAFAIFANPDGESERRTFCNQSRRGGNPRSS